VPQSVENYNQDDMDFLLDENANKIEAMILHFAATEKFIGYSLLKIEVLIYNKNKA
jgi:hypothetical protein